MAGQAKGDLDRFLRSRRVARLSARCICAQTWCNDPRDQAGGPERQSSTAKTFLNLPAWIALPDACASLVARIADRNQTLAGTVMSAITVGEGVKYSIPQTDDGFGARPRIAALFERPMARYSNGPAGSASGLDRKDAQLLPVTPR
jgi:hypothetical protein